ncbi:MAG TPA: DUF456 family protein [Phycisphaerales bacterium]|nr:DUF456 family protein [Phycisphaerales bacterium]
MFTLAASLTFYVAASLLVCVCLLGTALTIVGLPGIWIMIAAAAGMELWQPGTFSLWTIGATVLLAILAEVAELLSGAAGAKQAGASKRAIVGATIGGIIGGIAGTFVIPIIGTIIGGAIGAAIGASALEMTIAESDRTKLIAVGTGAFKGRLVATIVKGGFAVVVAGVLMVAVFV